MIASVFIYGRCEQRDYRWILPPSIPVSKGFCARLLEYNGRRLSTGEILYLKSQTDAGIFPYFLLSFQSNQMDERGRKIQFIIGFELNPYNSIAFNSVLPSLTSNLNTIVDNFRSILSGFVVSRFLPDQLIEYDFIKNTLVLQSEKTAQSQLLSKPEHEIQFQNKNLKIGHFMEQCIALPVKLGNFDFQKCGQEFNSNYDELQQGEISKLNTYHSDILPHGISAVWKDGYFASKETETQNTIKQLKNTTAKVAHFKTQENEKLSEGICHEDRAWDIHNENERKRLESKNFNAHKERMALPKAIESQPQSSESQTELKEANQETSGDE